jgi:hypothetical protein
MTLQQLFPLGSRVKLSRQTPWPEWTGVVVGYSGPTSIEVELQEDKLGRSPAEPHKVDLSFRVLTLVDPLEILAQALDDEK